jgi:hypothetical protein
MPNFLQTFFLMTLSCKLSPLDADLPSCNFNTVRIQDKHNLIKGGRENKKMKEVKGGRKDKAKMFGKRDMKATQI